LIVNFFVVLLFFILIVLGPGFLLFNLLIKDKSDFTWIELLPLSFLFGFVFFSAIGFPAYFFHFSHAVFTVALIGGGTILLVWNIILIFLKKRDFLLEKNRKSVLITLIFTALTITLILIWFPSINNGGDRLVHTGIMRRLAIRDPIKPYFDAFKDIPNKIDAGYGYNTWYLIGSQIIRTIPVGSNFIWEYLIIILAPFQLLAFGLLVRKINNSNLFYLIALMIFFFLAVVMNLGWELRLSPYPDQIARNMLTPVTLGLWILLLKREKLSKGILLGIILSAIALILVHMFSIIYFIIAIIGMMAFWFLADKKRQILKKGILILAGWIIIAAPILYLIYLNFLQIVPSNFGSASNKILIIGKYFIVNPALWNSFWIIVPLIVLILLCVWEIITRKKLSLGVLFCFALAFFATALCFIPPVSTFAGRIITITFLARMASIIPTYIIVALLIYEIIKNKKIWRIIALSLMSLLLIYFAWTKIPDFKDEIRDKKDRIDLLENKAEPIYNFINDNIPSSAVIVANEDLSYRLLAFTDNYLFMIPYGHCPAILDKKIRLAELNRLLNADYADRNLPLFRKYRIDYLITYSPEGYRKIPAQYKEIYSIEGQSIFKINY